MSGLAEQHTANTTDDWSTFTFLDSDISQLIILTVSLNADLI